MYMCNIINFAPRPTFRGPKGADLPKNSHRAKMAPNGPILTPKCTMIPHGLLVATNGFFGLRMGHRQRFAKKPDLKTQFLAPCMDFSNLYDIGQAYGPQGPNPENF